jgi:predicted ester cyclase
MEGRAATSPSSAPRGPTGVGISSTASVSARLVDGNFVTSRTVMAGRFDKEFAYTPIGAVEPNARRVRWELINIFRYTDEGRIAEEWVQTDTHEFLRQLGEV